MNKGNAGCYTITAVIPSWLTKVETSYEGDTATQDIIAALLINGNSKHNYTVQKWCCDIKRAFMWGSRGELR